MIRLICVSGLITNRSGPGNEAGADYAAMENVQRLLFAVTRVPRHENKLGAEGDLRP